MKKIYVIIACLFAVNSVWAVYNIPFENSDFDAGVQNYPDGFDASPDIPGWRDWGTIADSGVEGPGAWWGTYQSYAGFMKGGDAAYILSDWTIRADDEFNVSYYGKSWDGASEWTVTLFYDHPANIIGSFANSVGSTWTQYANTSPIAATGASVGHKLGILFENTGSGFGNLDEVLVETIAPVSFVFGNESPVPFSTNVANDVVLTATITDNDLTVTSVGIYLDNLASNVTDSVVSLSGSTTVSSAPRTFLPESTHTVYVITETSDASTWTNSWTFTMAPAFHPITVSPEGSGNTTSIVLSAEITDWVSTLNSATLYLDGTPLAIDVSNKVSDVTTISSTELSLAQNTTHTGKVVVAGSLGASATNEWIFSIGQYSSLSNAYYEGAALTNDVVAITGASEIRLTGGTPFSGGTVDLQSIDSWIFLPAVRPSDAIGMLDRVKVNGVAAVNNSNVRVAVHGQGSVIIPYPSGFQPLEVFEGENFTGDSMLLSPNTAYGTVLSGKISSFILKRGFEVTLASGLDGTGGVNYVAADGDLKISVLPASLNNSVNFVRVFAWNWVAKKGTCDRMPWDFNATWFYNWNAWWWPDDPNWEYVGIKQQPNWPGTPSTADASGMGMTHFSGYNEPNNPVEDAYKNLTPVGSVSDAVARWPDLEGSGLRIGAPAVTDGGMGWIKSFMDQAEAAGRRVDYIPIHYYRSYWNNNDPASAANNLYWFLKDIYDYTHKPIWLTEFNNGANWTTDADPTFAQNKNVIEAMINMMDAAPWVERYSVYSAVEEVRELIDWSGNITPMGIMYRDHVSPISYQQILPGEGMDPSASYHFEGSLDDSSGSGSHAISHDYPDFVAGHGGGTAIQFDGVDDHVILPDSLSDGTDFTFAAWVYWAGGSAWQRVFDFGIMESSEYMFITPMTEAGEGSTMRFAITTSGWGGEQRLTAPTALPQNTWTHLAVTISGNTGRLYVNGAQVAINASMTVDPEDLGAIQHYLGRSQFAADPYFNGKLDDVIITDVALSDAQIADLANGNQAPQTTTSAVDGGMAYEDVSYSSSVAGIASDPDEEGIVYSKVYGPSWLSVAPDGTLSGMPSGYMEADQNFTIRGTDAAGDMIYFTYHLTYVKTPPDFTQGPVAYWDFNDPSLGASDGAALPDSDAYAIWRTAAIDKSGNGNHLTTSDYSAGGFTWSTNSDQGDFSIVAAGAVPSAFTWSTESLPSMDVETVAMTNFTVEALFTCMGSGTRTVLGRDGQYLSSIAPNNAALYLSVDVNRHPLFVFTDVNSNRVRLTSLDVIPNDNTTWTHLAGVSDGSTVSLYLNGALVASESIAMGALATGTTDGSDWHAGGWSVGRGLRAGAQSDRWLGHIDSVAISGLALSPNHFVLTGTWPTGYDFFADEYGIPGAPFEGDWNSNGIPNGMEYYLGFNPTSTSPPPGMLTWTNDFLSAVHPFNTSAYGVTGSVEWTMDLTSNDWTAAGVSYTTNWGLGEIEATFGTETTNQLFIRLRVDN